MDTGRYASINASAYETEVLASEAKTKTFSLEAEARPRRLKFQLRRDRAEALLHLKTEASRPRLHPWLSLIHI